MHHFNKSSVRSTGVNSTPFWAGLAAEEEAKVVMREGVSRQIEELRRRLRGGKKVKSDWKPLVGSSTAWLALFVSAATAFYNFAYYSDELSVIIDIPTVELDRQKKRLNVDSPESIAFINSGTRPIAVTRVEMIIVQANSDRTPGCKFGLPGMSSFFDSRFEQMVIKPYDIVWKSIKFAFGPPGKEGIMDISEENKRRDPNNYMIIVCFAFDIVAANSGIWRKTIDHGPIHLINANPDETVFPARRGEPVRLIKRNVFWTEVGSD